MELNPEQQKAVMHFNGTCVVTACPGSGKTRVLTSRVISLVRDKNISPRSILCLTFTNKAAEEMKKRITEVLLKAGKEMWISTFHRLCLAVLRRYGNLIGLSPSFTIYNAKDQADLLAKIARMHEYEECSKNDIQRMAKTVNDFRENIVDLKQHLQELKPIEADIIKEYLETLDKYQALDFSGMLYKTWQCFKGNPDVVDAISRRFQYVSVDEMQDTNTVQYEIIRFIARSHANLFVVGDVQQSIYAFRGAKPGNLNRLRKDFKNVSEITLPRNYRSTQHILSAAQTLIRHNDDAKNVDLYAERGSGYCVDYSEYQHPKEEAESIAASIITLKKTQKYKWKDFAILYRINGFSRSPEHALRVANIPYKIVGGFSFFDRSEIKTTLAYLSLLANPYDTVAFARAVSLPKRFIGAIAIGKVERLCQQEGISVVEACKRIDELDKISNKTKESAKKFANIIERCNELHDKGMSLGEVSKKLLVDAGYYDFIKKQSIYESNDSSRFDNVEELLSSIVDFESRHKSCKVADYLQSIQLIVADSQKEDQVLDDAVQLLTMHSSKGKEWKCVYIIGVESGIVPHYRSIEEGMLEEERRLMYVAMSRASDRLRISWCTNRRNFLSEPSQFLYEIGVYEAG